MISISPSKKWSNVLMAFTLLLTFIGVYAIGYSSGNQASASPSVIDPSTANAYFLRYYRSAEANNAVIKGFSLDLEQFHAMQQIINQHPDTQGFRVYFGKTESNNRLGIVVGLDRAGNDKNAMIMQTSARLLESCPVVCDAASEITKE